MKGLPVISLVVVMFFSIAYDDPNSQKTPDREASLVIGYSSKVFSDVDIKDAQAATKLWMDLLIKNSESPFNKSETVIFHDLTALENGLKSKSVDIVVLFSQEFVEMKNRSPLCRSIRRIMGNTILWKSSWWPERASSS